VAAQACRLGARIVNDVSCGESEALLQVAADAGAQLVLMHNRGRGECTGANVHYRDVVGEVRDELLRAVDRALSSGVSRERIWLDPGIGFAKTAGQSIAVLANLGRLLETGQRVLVGASRKSFIAQLAPDAGGAAPDPGERGGGTAAAIALAVMQGAHAVRVHDVAMMRQAATIAVHVREARR
jgi:dihydropteroate synthase